MSYDLQVWTIDEASLSELLAARWAVLRGTYLNFNFRQLKHRKIFCSQRPMLRYVPSRVRAFVQFEMTAVRLCIPWRDGSPLVRDKSQELVKSSDHAGHIERVILESIEELRVAAHWL